MSAGLLLVLIFHVGILLDGLAISNLRLGQVNFHLILIQQSADDDLKMLIAHSVKEQLAVLGIVHGLHGQILVTDLLQSLGDLIHVALILGLITHVSIRRGDLEFTKLNGGSLRGKAVSGTGCGQFRKRADVAGMKLWNFHGLIALEHVDLTDLLFNVLVHVVHHVVGLQNAGVHLDQGVLTDERIHDGLPDICGFRLGEIVICVINLTSLIINSGHLTVLRAREVLDDVVK